ncbi:MAG: DNA primase [Wendovervirus sonii]|uniref:DNA primase n=1 Tax=phage Lak_Megaphage_Sonny TaxID=3109229 RepID=A0ABZ0Z5H8_9CAUD|nr:MAG: DNA primase [phage Lak_Megaphage_Sonny]
MTDFTLTLDTSSLTASNISEDVFNQGLIDKLTIILKREFKDNYAKQKIKSTKSGFNFACPFCHDSASDSHKKRAHLLTTGNFAGRFKCFNCGQSMTFAEFFKEFENPLSLSDVNYINVNYKNSSTNVAELSNNITAQVINKEEALKWAIDRDLLKNTLSLYDISKEFTPEAYNYLVGRCQYRNMNRFLYSAYYKQIIILNLVDNKVLGLQLRHIGPNYKGAKYLTMTIEKLRKMLLGDTTPVPETVSSLSCIFNIYNVDFGHSNFKPVLLTEGPFDAFLMPNCIATAGAAKNFKMNFPFWYIYDNDDTGNKHAVEMLKKGYNVFMWKKFKADYGIPEINPYSKSNNRKWDITDIMKYFRDNPASKQVLWQPYFTHDMLNGLNI